MAAASAAAAPAVVVVARGSDGVDGLREHLDDGIVMFGLLRLVIGQGSFGALCDAGANVRVHVVSGISARTKIVFIHFNAEGCNPVSFYVYERLLRTESR